VAAGSQLIPHLAARQVLVRFPDHVGYQSRDGQALPVDWIAVDLDHQIRYAKAFPQEQKALKRSVRLLNSLSSDNYRVQQVSDGVVVLQRDGTVNPEAQRQLDQLLQQAKQR
jgi:hypothetical protein